MGAGAVYTPEREERFSAALPPRYVPLAQLSFFLGVRGGQLVGLRWECVQGGFSVLSVPSLRTQPSPGEVKILLETMSRLGSR